MAEVVKLVTKLSIPQTYACTRVRVVQSKLKLLSLVGEIGADQPELHAEAEALLAQLDETSMKLIDAAADFRQWVATVEPAGHG
jgi:hypothetical protein